MFSEIAAHDFRIHDQTRGDVLGAHEATVEGQKRVRHRQSPVGRVVERAFEPLRGRGECRVLREHDDVAG